MNRRGFLIFILATGWAAPVAKAESLAAPSDAISEWTCCQTETPIEFNTSPDDQTGTT